MISLAALLVLATLDLPRVSAPPVERPHEPASVESGPETSVPRAPIPPRMRAIAEAFGLRADVEPSFVRPAVLLPERTDLRFGFGSPASDAPTGERLGFGRPGTQELDPALLEPNVEPASPYGSGGGSWLWNSGSLEAGFDRFPELSRYGSVYTLGGDSSLRISVAPCW